MALKRGRFGMFYACTGYPDCKTTRQVGKQERKPDVPLDEKCPQCDSQMMRKTGRFGEFTACGNYPDCRYIKQETIGWPARARPAGAKSPNAVRGAARRFTAAPGTPIATSRPGASPST